MDNSTTNDSGGDMGANNDSMTTMDETLREAQRLINSIVTPRNTVVMGHWNVRSMYRVGATTQVAREQRLCCCPRMEARGEEKQRQTQNNLASHCGEGERQTRLEHMGNSKTGSKQPPAVEG